MIKKNQDLVLYKCRRSSSLSPVPMPALVNQDKAGEAEAEVPGQWVIYQAGSEGRMQKAGGTHWVIEGMGARGGRHSSQFRGKHHWVSIAGSS